MTKLPTRIPTLQNPQTPPTTTQKDTSSSSSSSSSSSAAVASSSSASSASPPKPPPKIYILLPNPQKSNNLGPILRCAAAYATHQIVMVGYDKCSTDGSHGSAKHLDIITFPTLKQAVVYVRDCCGVRSIVGLIGDVGIIPSYDIDSTADMDDYYSIEGGEEEVMEDEEKKVVKVVIGRRRDERRRSKNRLVPDSDADEPTVDTRRQTDPEPSYEDDEGSSHHHHFQKQPYYYSYPPSFPVYQRPFSTTRRINKSPIRQTSATTIQQTSHSALEVKEEVEVDGNIPEVVDEGVTAATAIDGTKKDVCFSISKQRIGLPIDQARYCDFFLHIPRMSLFSPGDDDDVVDDDEDMLNYGILDTQTSLSIALHHYTAWAKYEERTISGHKFDLNQRQNGLEDRSKPGYNNDRDRLLLQDERKECRKKLEQAGEDAMEEGDWSNLFIE